MQEKKKRGLGGAGIVLLFFVIILLAQQHPTSESSGSRNAEPVEAEPVGSLVSVESTAMSAQV
jgi:hypothetical protein